MGRRGLRGPGSPVSTPGSGQRSGQSVASLPARQGGHGTVLKILPCDSGIGLGGLGKGVMAGKIF